MVSRVRDLLRKFDLKVIFYQTDVSDIADLQISKSPIGPTKKFGEALYSGSCSLFVVCMFIVCLSQRWL